MLLEAGADPKIGYPSPRNLLPRPPIHSHKYSTDAPLPDPIDLVVAFDLLLGRNFVDFSSMSEAQLMQWALDNPERLHTRGCDNNKEVTLLRVAVEKGYAVLATWLIDEMKMGKDGHWDPSSSLLHLARTAGVMRALMRLPIDLTARYFGSQMIIIYYAERESVEGVAALLGDIRVVATINATAEHPRGDFTALHFACVGPIRGNYERKARIVELLFQAGADINVGLSPSSSPSGCHEFKPASHLISVFKGPGIPERIVELYKQAWEERGSVLLVRIRRIIAFENCIKNAPVKVGASKDQMLRKRLDAMPTYLKSRVKKGQAKPQVELKDLPSDDEE